MRKLFCVLAVVLGVDLGILATCVLAQKSPPRVPTTYPGDTNETIARRAQWIEGAKKDQALEWWGVLSPPEAAKVAEEFNKTYPFIKVSYWRGKGEEVAAKLEAELSARNPSVDIVLGGEPYNYPRWRKMGALEPYTDIIPGIRDIEKRMYSKYHDWAMPGHMAMTPQYNTKLVSGAEAPKTWDDLLDPKWKGQVAITTDVKAWTTLALDEGGWGIEKTESFLRRMKEQKPIWVSSRPGGNSLLIAGDIKIFGETYLTYALQAQDKGAPVEWSRVRPIPVGGPSLAFRKNAPHANAARLFLEWLFSPPGLIAYDKVTLRGVATPGAGTRQAKALEGLPLVFQTEEGIIKGSDMGLEKRFASLLGAPE